MKYTKPTGKRTPAKRPGRVTKDEKAVVKAIVRQAGGDLPLDRTKALAKVFNRPVGAVKAMVTRAKDNLAADAEFYVDTHRDAVETALEHGKATSNDKMLEVARKGSEWALEHTSGDGKRIIDQPSSAPQGTRIMIGVKLSNTTLQPEMAIDISPEALEANILDG